jgi:uncharacterized protein YggT (Ycf19 family)
MTEKQVISGIIGRDCSPFMAPFRNIMPRIQLFSFILHALTMLVPFLFS